MSGDESSVLERAWAVLAPPRSREFASYPLDLAFRGTACRVALDLAGARHVLIPVHEERVLTGSRSSILELALRRLSFGEDDATYLDLSCGERDLFPEFDEVVADVLEAARESGTPGSAVVRAVGRWRRLFRSRWMRGLSHQARLGLFAELTVLSELFDVDPLFSLDMWRGPLREPHDFEAPARCIEVKALGAQATTVTVHGLEQLDSHAGRGTDLLLLRVVDDAEGRTLTDLIEELRGRVPSKRDLQQRLAAAGWSPSFEHEDLERFGVGEFHCVPMSPGTPRLVVGDLREGALRGGVVALTYEVDVEALLTGASEKSLHRAVREALQ